MYGDADNDYIRACHILDEISDRLLANHKQASALLAQAKGLKAQKQAESADLQSTFNLRRFNVDLSQESIESELERTNARIIIENHTLTQENRQLSMLLKEYEQTMETVMSKYRSHALAAQQHELTLTRHYDALLAHESHFVIDPNLGPSIRRLEHGLRALQLSLAGKDATSNPPPAQPTASFDPHPPHIPAISAPADPSSHPNALDNAPARSTTPPFPPDSSEPAHLHLDSASSPAPAPEQPSEPSDEDDEDEPLDWTIARELEIARLDAENTRLRAVLGINREALEALGVPDDEDYVVPLVYIPTNPAAHAGAGGSGSEQGGESGSGNANANAQGGGAGQQNETGLGIGDGVFGAGARGSNGNGNGNGAGLQQQQQQQQMAQQQQQHQQLSFQLHLQRQQHQQQQQQAHARPYPPPHPSQFALGHGPQLIHHQQQLQQRHQPELRFQREAQARRAMDLLDPPALEDEDNLSVFRQVLEFNK